MDGMIVATRLEDGRVRIDQADKHVRITISVLDTLIIKGGIVRLGDVNPVSYRIVTPFLEAERIDD